MTTETSEVLEWHRVDVAVLRSLATGAITLLCGPILAAVGFVGFKHQLPVEIAFAVVAGICVVAGPAYAFVHLARLLREDACLSARVDGVVFERNGKSLHMSWEDIEKVELEPPTTLVFHRRKGEAFVLHERFATIGTRELQKRLEELRRKASFGLLLK